MDQSRGLEKQHFGAEKNALERHSKSEYRPFRHVAFKQYLEKKRSRVQDSGIGPQKIASECNRSSSWEMNFACRLWSACGFVSFFSGAALFFDPEMSFSRPRDWSILFSAAACLFFDLQLFVSPAMRPRKRAQSFFQPLCIILSSLFLGPKTSCSEPRIFFRTPRHLFLDLRCFFSPLLERRTQGEVSKSQIRNSAN